MERPVSQNPVPATPAQTTPDMPPVYVVAHIPKTAGQTLRDHFLTHLELHDSFVHLGPVGDADAKAKGIPPLTERPVEQRKNARVVLGHGVTRDTAALFPGRAARLITFLRDPAEQMVSLYNFTMEHSFRQKSLDTIPFETWYKHNRHNTCLRWLDTAFCGAARDPDEPEAEMFRRVVELLDGFWLVGTLETFDTDAARLMQATGLPKLSSPRANVTGRDFARTLTMSNALRARIYADCSYDVALHRYALRRRMAGPA